MPATNLLRKSFFPLCAAYFFLAIAVHAQTADIRGIVSDSSTGERIPFANVVIVGTSKGAATNTSGFYLIPSALPGAYEIAASAIGFQRSVKQILVPAEGTMTVNFALLPQPVEMEEIVITEQSKREVQEISTSVHVMTQRDLRLVPTTVQQDIFRSIQILPGVVSASDVSSHFYVRGGASDQNLILLDGIRIYNPYHAMGIFSIFDSDVINTTEVYTGAFPAGYGGRLSSVVNLTTKDGTAGGFSARSNINFLSSKFQIDGAGSEHLRWIFNGRKSLFTDTFRRFFQQNVPINFYDAFGKITYIGDESHTRFSVTGFLSGDELPSGKAVEPDYYWSNGAIGGRLTTLFGDRLFVNTMISFTSYEARRDPKASNVIPPATTGVQEFSLRSDLTLYSSTSDLLFFGFDFSFPHLYYSFVNSNGVGRDLSATSPDISAWGRMQTKLGNWQIDAGIHADLGSISRGGGDLDLFQPRLHLGVPILPSWKAKLSYGRFSQHIVTINNEDDLISIFEAWVGIPDKLKSQRADHYVAGLEGNLIAELSANLQAYYKDYRSLLLYNREKLTEHDPDYLNAKGSAYGVEALLRFGMRWIDAYAAYTLSWVNLTQGAFTYPPRYDRRHTVKLLTTVRPTGNLDVSLRWDLGSGFPYTPAIGFYDRLRLRDVFESGYNGEIGQPYVRLGEKNVARLPYYHRLDASVSYRLTLGPFHGTVGAHVINAYDRKNIFYFDRKTGQRIDMLRFYPTFTLQLEYVP
ncbi:MAG TPA: TonB-dependent receptor [Bacteroidota bacterium]|nr:TonB-dependent receptor [Bacteroidota bacterium]